MKKIVFFFFCFSIINFSDAQTLNKDDAARLFEKTFSYLKNNDTASFIKLWKLDNAAWPYHNRPFEDIDVIKHFEAIKIFLDSALIQNLKIESIDVEKQDANDKKYFAPYKITAWFRYKKSLVKGIAFYVEFIDGKWKYRFSPDYTTISSRPKIHK